MNIQPTQQNINIRFRKKKNHSPPQNNIIDTIWKIIHIIAIFYAIYLSFKCNNGFSFIPFLFALVIPEIYIIYIIAVQKFCNNNEEEYV